MYKNRGKEKKTKKKLKKNIKNILSFWFRKKKLSKKPKTKWG